MIHVACSSPVQVSSNVAGNKSSDCKASRNNSPTSVSASAPQGQPRSTQDIQATLRIRWRRVSCVARQCGRRVSIKAWSVETHDGQAKLWCNRTDNQHCRFCVQDCRSFHVEAPFTFEARCTPEPYDTAIAPVRPCRGRTFGIASRRTSIIGNDSGLL